MAQTVNLVLEQGTTFKVEITVNDGDSTAIDISDYTCESQMRLNYDSDSSYDITCTILGNAGDSTGRFNLTLTDTQTALIEPGRWLYDVEMRDDTGDVSRLIEGNISVIAEVTK